MSAIKRAIALTQDAIKRFRHHPQGSKTGTTKEAADGAPAAPANSAQVTQSVKMAPDYAKTFKQGEEWTVEG